jgi:hypothetical protein
MDCDLTPVTFNCYLIPKLDIGYLEVSLSSVSLVTNTIPIWWKIRDDKVYIPTYKCEDLDFLDSFHHKTGVKPSVNYIRG